MKRNILSKLLAVLLCLGVVLMLPACSTQSTDHDATPSGSADVPSASDVAATENAGFTLTDDLGRQITFAKPVTRAAVVNRYNLELLRACGLIDLVVGVDDSIIENSVYWPEFAPEDSFGNQQELNYEKIASLEPDVVILPASFYTDELESTMSAFDIPVVAVTGYSSDFIKQMDIIDTLFGNTSDSEALRSFYMEVSQKINSVISGIDEADRKTFCWESIKDYSIALSSNAWSEMVVAAGGVNVFGNASFTESTVDAEAMITANPDVIFKMVAATGTDLSGYTPPSAADYEAAEESYTSRVGFDRITSVQNGDVYFVTSFSMGGMGKMIGTAFAAKWLYPEQFADFDAEAVFGRWLEDFQNIDSISGHSDRLGGNEG